MRILDISLPLSEDILINPGDLPSTFCQENQGQYLVGDLHLSSHTGMYIDTSVHCHKTGDTIDTVPVSCLIGKCQMLDVTGAGTITAYHLKSRLDGVKRSPIKMDFSLKDQFGGIYPALGLDAANMITGLGMNWVGIDTPSIELDSSPARIALLVRNREG